MTETDFDGLRQRMLMEITTNTIYTSARLGKAALSRRVMEALEKVPRHAFVRSELLSYAYANMPLPIGFDKTISQPFIVAVMTDMLDLQPTDRVLEIGTGLGYQSALLAELAQQVYSIELIPDLALDARRRLGQLGYRNIEFRVADGALGWPEQAPFDKILVAAAPQRVPQPLLDQLKPGGRMAIPAGASEEQQLLLVQKDLLGKIATKEILPVRFSQLDGPGAA